MRAWVLLMIGLASAAGCGSTTPTTIPADVKSSFPGADALKISIPGKRGAAGSASEMVFVAVDKAAAALQPMTVLQEYLTKGGEESRGIAITVALEGAPHVADQIVRYTRVPSRLDVERSGTHAFFYLQYDDGRGFDPDSAVGETHMLIEGSTVVPSKVGTRSVPSKAVGLSNPSLGYLRFHFNLRPEDSDPVRSAAQLDYNTGTGSLHLAYFTLPTATGDKPVAFWLMPKSDGSGGLVYSSIKGSKGLAYEFVAQYTSDGSMAVWKGDGTLGGCYDGEGQELGNAKSPAGCSSFKQKMVAPPSNSDLWPGLPGGLP
jgi:hypothetical protein